MPSFREKLRRLRPATATGSKPSVPTINRASPTDGSEESLAALRKKLEALCARGEAVPPTTRDAPKEALPFEVESSPMGQRLVRRVHWPLDSKAGAVTLAAALDAAPAMLGLLGLTPVLADCSVAGALYLDAETTGLGGSGSVAFVVGMAQYEAASDAYVFEQLFLPDLGCEAPLLERVRERLEQAEFVVTYNGKSFDLPLLRTRCVMNGLPPLVELPHLDLLHLVRRVHRHRPWRKSLTSVEQHVLLCPRGPDVAGADVAERYHHYLRSGDAAGIFAVLDHNLEDVRSLVALLGLYGEPLMGTRLEADEIANAARVAKRVGRLETAQRFVEHAVEREATPLALRTRAEIAKARGDKQQALEDFQTLAREVDDPSIRLELAKLYEHYLRSPRAALHMVDAGTSEAPSDDAHRRARLERKLSRNPSGSRR